MWASGIPNFISVLAFFLVLKLIRKYREDIISSEELNLIVLSGLLVGWPKFVAFVPVFLGVTLAVSLINLIILKKKNTDLSLPVILSLIIVFTSGVYLIKLLYLSALIM